jgi:hypothetical protein
MSNFFYDKQIRRFIAQVVSVFSHFEVEYGTDNSGNVIYQRVPVKYATSDKMTASILKNNSENTMLSVPAISVNVSGLEYERDRVQDPSFVDKMNIRQKKFNKDTGEYSIASGNAFTVERHMPVPYKLSFTVDIWTSSTEQKLQLLEQILVLFNPAFEIQSTDNYIDWTSLSYIHLDTVNYSSRTVPTGTEESLDIATLGFYCPIWISPPAKLKKLGVIETIIASIYDAGGNLGSDVVDAANRLGDRLYTTPTGHNLLILNGQANIFPAGHIDRDNTLGNLSQTTTATPWAPYVNTFGELKNGITQLRLRKNNPDTVSEIVGTVSYHPTDPSVLLFNVDLDTTPANTLPPIDAIMDPTRSAPGVNGLPAAQAGQRYLLLNSINSGKAGDTSYDGADAWKNTGVDFVAGEYDIIQYTGSAWTVSWQASGSQTTQYVTNLTTGIQYKWNSTGWVKSWEGEYPAGTWSLVF